MSEPRFQSLTRTELVDELRKLGREIDAGELDGLVEMGLLPVLDGPRERFPLFALVQVVDGMTVRTAGELEELRRRAGVFGRAVAGFPDGLSGAHRELRQILARRSVLGELHRMLPVMEWAALETLRGEARLEWRLRMSLTDLTRLMAMDRFRDDTMTPILLKSVESDASTRSAESLAVTRSVRGGTLHPLSDERGERPPTHPAGDDQAADVLQTWAGRQRLPEGETGAPRQVAAGTPVTRARPLTPATAPVPTASEEPSSPAVSPRRGELRTGRMPILRQADEPAPLDDHMWPVAPLSGAQSHVRADEPLDDADEEQTESFVVPTTASAAERYTVSPQPLARDARREEVVSSSDEISPREHSSSDRPTVAPETDVAGHSEHPQTDASPPPTFDSASFFPWSEPGTGSSSVDVPGRPSSPQEPSAGHPWPDITELPTDWEFGQSGASFLGGGPEQPDSVWDEGESSRVTSRRAAPLLEPTPSSTRLGHDPLPPHPGTPGVASIRDAAGSFDGDSGRKTHALSGLAKAHRTGRTTAHPVVRPQSDTPMASSPARMAFIDAEAGSGHSADTSSSEDVSKPPVEVASSRPMDETVEASLPLSAASERPLRPGASALSANPIAVARANVPTSESASTSATNDATRRPNWTTAALGLTTARPARTPRATANLVSTESLADFVSMSGSRESVSSTASVQLPLRGMSSETRSLDIHTVGRNPRAAFERAQARLQRDPADAVAQDELIALIASSDRLLARDAWLAVQPTLADRADRANVYFGALVTMAERDPETALRVEWLCEAATLADTVLGQHAQAFELLVEALRLAPSNSEILERAETLAEARGWWGRLADGLEAGMSGAADAETLVALARLAGNVARHRLGDIERAVRVISSVIERDIYDDRLVGDLVDLFTLHGRYADLLLLLLRSADLARGEEHVARLTRAADLCVEELGDITRAMEIYETALERGAALEVRERYVALAKREGLTARASERLASSLEDPFLRALEQARIAREEFSDDEAEVRALAQAFTAPGSERITVGFQLADAQRRRGNHAAEIETLESMLAATRTADEYASVVRRLAGVFAARSGGTVEAIELYSEAIRTRRYDEKIVHALASLLRAEGQIDRLVTLYHDASAEASSAEQRTTYLRQMAKVAAELIADDEIALATLERAADESEGDHEVLLRLADRCGAAGDELSELAALEQAVGAASAPDVAPRVLTRLAELLTSRPRGAARAAVLLERVLALDSLESDVEGTVGRILPRIATESGRSDLELAWLERTLQGAVDMTERLVLLKQMVRLHDVVAVSPERRVEIAELALATALGCGATDLEVASLRLGAARARMALGHWNAAMEVALAAAETLVALEPDSDEAAGSVAAIVELRRLVIDDRPALVMLQRVASSDVLSLQLAFVRACVAHGQAPDAATLAQQILPRLRADTDARDELERAFGPSAEVNA